MKTLFIAVFGVVVIGLGLWWYITPNQTAPSPPPKPLAKAPAIPNAAPTKTTVDLNLPDCPQGATAPITGPNCIQPHFRKLPPHPDPVENNKTLAGIDSDKDGVRDDVQWAIAEIFWDSARMRAAAHQYAFAKQKQNKGLTAPLKDEAVLITEEAGRARICIAAIHMIKDPALDSIDALSEGQQQIDELIAVFRNTPGRIQRERDMSRNMSGAAFTGNDVRGKTWDSLCTFNLQSMDN